MKIIFKKQTKEQRLREQLEKEMARKEKKQPIEPIKVEEKKLGLKDQMDEIKTTLDDMQGKKKKRRREKKVLKFPFMMERGMKRRAKRGMVIVVMLQSNKIAMPKWGLMKEGSLIVDGKEYDGSVATVFNWRGKGRFPIIFLPEWSITPLNAEDNYADAVEDGRLIDPQILMVKALERKEAEGTKRKISPMAILGGLVAIGIVAYIIMSGSGAG